jgi:hypothetical protein
MFNIGYMANFPAWNSGHYVADRGGSKASAGNPERIP